MFLLFKNLFMYQIYGIQVRLLQQMNKNYMWRENMKYKCILVIIITGLICLGGQVLGRYILTKNIGVNITTSPFYFEAEVENDEIELIDNKAEINLTIKNNNGTNYNLYDTNYEITLQENGQSVISVEDENSQILKGESIKQNNVKIKFEKLVEDSIEQINLIIKSKKPYKKEIVLPITFIQKTAESKLTEAEKVALKANGIEELTESSITNVNLKDNENIKAVLTGQVPLPTQFEYVEGTKDTGLVISTTYNNVTSEFVWVPVPVAVANSEKEAGENKAMALNLGTSTSPKYRGLLYNFSGTTSSVMSNCTTTTTNFREPANLNSVYDNSSNISGWTSTTYQTDYDNMIKSVIKYGGFYIGRYETSKTTSTVASTKGTSSTRPITNAQWYNLYIEHKKFSDDVSLNTVKSSMLWGSQYDAMLNWALNGADASKITTPANISKTNQTYQPGTKEVDKINNIYDISGNVIEATLEANLDYARVFRGGYYGECVAPSERRWYNMPIVEVPNLGSRLTLYII